MISDDINSKILPNGCQQAVDWGPTIAGIGMAATHLSCIAREIEEAAMAAFKECERPLVDWLGIMRPYFSDPAAKIDTLRLDTLRFDPCEPVNTSPASAVEFLEQKRQRVAERQAEERRGRIKPWDKKRFR